jgi:hypothetical protein
MTTTPPMMVREYMPRARDLGQTATPVRLRAEPWATDAKPMTAVARTKPRTLANRKAAVLALLNSLPPGEMLSGPEVAQATNDTEAVSMSSLLTNLWKEGRISRARAQVGPNWLVKYGRAKA